MKGCCICIPSQTLKCARKPIIQVAMPLSFDHGIFRKVWLKQEHRGHAEWSVTAPFCTWHVAILPKNVSQF